MDDQPVLILNEPVEVELTWPPRGLFPNRARTQHWSKNARLAAAYRRECWILTKASKARGTLLKVVFHPPSRRRIDDDNAIAAFKSGRDGVADALGVDDNTFRPEYRFATAEPVKWGKVVVTIGDAL
jgi:crossover junction endodeoxyribonuclease RusA